MIIDAYENRVITLSTGLSARTVCVHITTFLQAPRSEGVRIAFRKDLVQLSACGQSLTIVSESHENVDDFKQVGAHLALCMRECGYDTLGEKRYFVHPCLELSEVHAA